MTYNQPNPLKGKSKTEKNPVKIIPQAQLLRKPEWIRSRLPGKKALSLIKQIKQQSLHTVCQEANCPNLGECYTKGTATFMILGDICTRRCPFCDVAHGNPLAVDPLEADRLAETVARMQLNYVVITSVDRDDLRDGGAGHFSDCIRQVRLRKPDIKIEILTPDFRQRMERALEALSLALPDVFNHNLETVPDLYRKVRPGADYQWSLDLLQEFSRRFPHIPTKSGLMLGVGETREQLIGVLKDMRVHGITMLTLGQYLQPGKFHLPVEKYYHPSEFKEFEQLAYELGFEQVASGPLVRSSYHADLQASGKFPD